MLFWLRHSNISGLNYEFCLKNITKKILKREEIDASCQNSVKETGLDALLLNRVHSPSPPEPKEDQPCAIHAFYLPQTCERKWEVFVSFQHKMRNHASVSQTAFNCNRWLEYKIFHTVLYQLQDECLSWHDMRFITGLLEAGWCVNTIISV